MDDVDKFSELSFDLLFESNERIFRHKMIVSSLVYRENQLRPKMMKTAWVSVHGQMLSSLLLLLVANHQNEHFASAFSDANFLSRAGVARSHKASAEVTRMFDVSTEESKRHPERRPVPTFRNFDIPNRFQDDEDKSKSFSDFDYWSHWYPVVWARDLIANQPTKVTLFDTDYVVARTNTNRRKHNQEEVIAMVDQCPHKQAALSEGRITASGFLQCSYHGWSFNGTTGDCVEIPQLVKTNDRNALATAISSPRSCAAAVPAMIQQGMVYIFPGGNLERALLEPPPLTIPEMNQKRFKISRQIVDLPVDWPILLENILDPDHGVFTHQMGSFDWYSAANDVPLQIAEDFPNKGKGWQIKTRVDAVDKILAVDRSRRNHKRIVRPNLAKASAATTIFAAPSFVLTGRRNKMTGKSNFLIGFWVCPVGTGRSRLMTATIAKSPFSLPRWVTSIAFNNFVDQDTYLLATQHQHLLKKEAEESKNALEEAESNDGILPTNFNSKVRKTMYNFRSPTEQAANRIANFWDATLHRAPNRISSLLAMDKRGALTETPPRHEVLDRARNHLRICPDSQAVVQNCQNIQKASTIISVLTIALKAYATLAFPFNTGASLLNPNAWNWKLVTRIRAIPNAAVGATLVLSVLAGWWAEKVRREFYFKADQNFHLQDLENIPKKVWLDA